MTIADIDAVMALAARSPGGPHWPRRIYEEAARNAEGICIAVFDGDMLVGFAIARVVIGLAELELIVIEEAYRRQGIGSALLAAVLERSRQAGARRLELEVRAGNRAAISLYERAGFVLDGVRRSYYKQPPEDALLMSLLLDFRAVPLEKNP